MRPADDRTSEESDPIGAMLCDALDAAAVDPRRLELLTIWCLHRYDPHREAELDRLRREGIPPVMKV